MALTGTDRGTGTHNTTLSSWGIAPASNFAAGSLAVLCLSVDNAGTSGASPITGVTDSLGNTWTQRFNVSSFGTTLSGSAVAIFTAPMVTPLTTGASITVALSPATIAKTYTLMEVAGAGGALSYVTGASANFNTTAPTITTSSIPVGDMVIGCAGIQQGTAQVVTPDSDSTNGSWSTHQTATIGTTNAGQTITSQRKVQATAASPQTYNVGWGTSDRSTIIWIQVHEAPPPQTITAVGGIASGENFGQGYYSSVKVTPNLISYYRLGEPSGTTMIDEFLANMGTYPTVPTLGVAGALGDGSTAATFATASSQYGAAKQNGRIVSGLSAWSIEAWVKTSTSGQDMCIYSERSASGNDILKLEIGGTATPNGAARGRFRDDASTLNDTTGTAALTNGAWHHLVWTLSGTTFTLYVDGVQQATASRTATLTMTDATPWCEIGGDRGDPAAYFNGQIDEVAVYSRALTAAEVAQHYKVAPVATDVSAIHTGVVVRAVGAIASGEVVPGGNAYRGTILGRSGLVGYWRLGESSNASPMVDETGVYTGSYAGGPTMGAAGAIADGNTAMTVASTGQGLVQTTTGALDAIGDVLTLEAWIYPTAATIGCIISKGGGSYLLRLDGSGNLNFLRGQTADIVHSTIAVPLNGWHHVVATKNGATVKLYIDAVDVTGSVSNSTNPTGGAWLFIGCENIGNFGGTFFVGSIDEVAIYNRDLSAAEVLANYSAASGAGGLTLAVGAVTLTAVGAIASAEAFGTLTATTVGGTQNVTAVGAIASGEAVGTSSYTVGPVTISAVGAIASAEALGNPTAAIGGFTLTAVGAIASGEAVGTPSYSVGAVTVTAVGAIASGEALGNPTAGLPVLAISAVGAIASVEALGIPARSTAGPPITLVGIASAQALGVPSWAGVNALTLVGIASAQALGVPAISQPLFVVLIGIPSGEAFGALGVGTTTPWRRWKTIQYHAYIFSADPNGGPANPKLELDPDILNLVWQQRQNEAGQAAFAMARHNKKLDQINWMVDHIKIFRESAAGTVVVFAGKPVKPLWSGTDVLVYCWDYLAFLQLSRTGYKTAYPTKLIGTEIVSPEWFLAKNASNSPFAFVADGTIENPLGLDGTTPIKTNSKFGVVDFDRLFAFSSIAQMAMANTANNVKFEITRGDGGNPHTFNFWKNYGVRKFGFAAVDPGNLASYNFDGGRDATRNDLATVLSDGLGGHVEYLVASSDVTTTNLRRLQAALPIRTLFGTDAGGSTTETDQGKAALARQLIVSQRYPRSVVVQPRQGEFDPFIEAELGDQIRHTIANANRDADMYDGYLRLVAVSGSWDARHGELLQLESQGVP